MNPTPPALPRGAAIIGLGMCAPDRVLTNAEIAQSVDTSDEWIVSRTGIRERRIVDESEATSDLSIRAAGAALRSAGVSADGIDLILCATTTGDYIWPATACLIQRALGARKAGAFDLSAACSGFCYGLACAAGMIQSGALERVLVIGADCLSRQVDWQDRSTCILFGDGAGAAVLGPCGAGDGILASSLGSEGGGYESVWLPAGGVRTPITPEILAAGGNCLKMQGREVYRFALEIVPSAVCDVLGRAGLETSDIRLLVPHQANARIIEAVGQRLGIPPDRIFVNVDRYGNTSAASVPMALAEIAEQGLLERGDIVVTVGFGAGLTWASNALRWTL